MASAEIEADRYRPDESVSPEEGKGQKRTADEADLRDGYNEDQDHRKAPRRDEFAGLDHEIQSKLAALEAKGLIRISELDDNVLRELGDFPTESAREILEQFAACDMGLVRNKAGFLGGMMARFRRQPGPKLQHDIQQRLDSMFRAKKIRASDLDAKCYEYLAAVPVPVATTTLDRFAARDLRDVRSLPAFFMSMLRSAEKDHEGGRGRDDYGARGAPPYASSYPAHGVRAMVAPGRQYHGHEHRQLGVRVDEFHALADSAPYVPTAVALKLQSLWDSGVRVVSQLDDRSWDLLAELPAPEGLAAIEEVVAAMHRGSGLRNLNAYFMTVAGKMIPKSMVDVSSKYSSPPRAAPTYPSYSGFNSRPSSTAYDSQPRAGYSGAAVGSRYGPPMGGRDGPGMGPAGIGGGGGGVSTREPPPNRGVSALHLLTSETVRAAVERALRADSRLQPDHFDEGVVTCLNRLGSHGATSVLDEVLTNDLAMVRNMPAYIMGICKRYRSRHDV